MNKKGLSLQTLTIQIVLASMFFVGFWGMYADMASHYDVTVDGNFSDSFDKIDETKSIAEDLATNVEGAEATVTDQIVSYLSSGISSLKIVLGSVGIVTDLAEAVRDFLGIPAFIFNSFIAIFLLAVSFAIVAALIGRNIQ